MSISCRHTKVALIISCALSFWAATAYCEIEENSVDESTALVHRAIDLEDYDSAIELLTQAVAIDPRNAQAYFERGIALMNLDRDADAVADFSSALEIHPHFPGALSWRSKAFAALDDYESAASDCQLELEWKPAGRHAGMGVSPQQWADCARLHVKASNPGKAREILEMYFDEYSSMVTMYASDETSPMRELARLYLEGGETDLALQLARQAYSSNYQKPTDILVLALALEASGDLVGARKICAEAMAVNDRMPGLQRLHRRLEE